MSDPKPYFVWPTTDPLAHAMFEALCKLPGHLKTDEAAAKAAEADRAAEAARAAEARADTWAAAAAEAADWAAKAAEAAAKATEAAKAADRAAKAAEAAAVEHLIKEFLLHLSNKEDAK